MVNNLVFRWPKPLFFMVLGDHGVSSEQIVWYNLTNRQLPVGHPKWLINFLVRESPQKTSPII